MKKQIQFYCTLLCLNLFPFLLHSESWSPPQTIPAAPTSQASSNVTVDYNPATQEVFAAWVDTNTGNPFYSIYTSGSGWNTPSAISLTSGVLDSIFLLSKPDTGQVFAAWSDNTNDTHPTYSIYTPGFGWSPVATIPAIAPTTSVHENVTLVYNKNTTQILAAWGDSSDATIPPTYSIYNTLTGWTTPARISITSEVLCDVYLGYDDLTGEVFATWGDFLNSNYPTYSVFNGTTWSVNTPITTLSAVQSCVTIVYDALTHQFITTWSDPNNGMLPTYSIYTIGTGWSAPATISTTSQPFEDVFLTYDSGAGLIFAAWIDVTDQTYPTYSIFSNNVWTPATPITTLSTGFLDVSLTYDSVKKQIFASWNGDNSTPTWSFYQSTSPTPPIPPLPPIPLPPSSISGSQKQNRFLTQTDRYNKIRWRSSPSSGIVAYKIYRDGVFLTKVSSNTHSYEDHNRKKGKSYTYAVTALGNDGQESSPISMMIDNL